MWHTRPYKIFPWPLFHFFLTCPCTPTCGVFIQSSIVFPQCTMLFLQLLFALCGISSLPLLCIQQELTTLWQVWKSECSPGKFPGLTLSSNHSSVVLSCSEFEVPIYPSGFPFIFSPLSMVGWFLALQILQPTPTISPPMSQLVYIFLGPVQINQKRVLSVLTLEYSSGTFLLDTMGEPSASSLDLVSASWVLATTAGKIILIL